MTLDLQATPEEVMRAVETLEKFALESGVPEKSVFGLTLALEECGANIVNHALKGDAQQTFQVVIEMEGDVLVIELHDRGPEFDPTAAADRELQADDDDLPGSWGIQLVRRYVDEVRYKRVADENVLRLTKRIGPTATPE